MKEIKEEMLKYSDLDGHIIVGFPRDVAQMETFESQARVDLPFLVYVLKKYFTALFCVQVGAKPNLILIDCSESELEKSLRSSSPDSKLLSRQSLKSYRENTIPLLKVLDKQNRLKIVSVRFRLTK